MLAYTAYEQTPAPRNVDANQLDSDIASSGERPLNDNVIISSESPRPPSNGKPWSLGADKKAGFSSDRERPVQRYLTGGSQNLKEPKI